MYSMNMVSVLLYYNYIIFYACTDQIQVSVFPQSQSGILYVTLLYRYWYTLSHY